MAPYQIFFPIGVLNAMLAVGVWLVQNLNWFSTPPILIHSKLIVGGFLWSFIVGFLMTAIPRMSGTAKAHHLEFLLGLILIAGLTISSWFIDSRVFYGTHIALIIFMIIYAGRRILTSTKPIPIFFSHVGAAMLLALTGAFYHFNGNSYMGIHLYHVGTILLLVLGIGTRFFSFLSGLPSNFEAESSSGQKWIFHGMAFVVAALLYMGGRGLAQAYLGLTGVSLAYLFFIWKIQRPSERPSALKHGVRIVAASIPLSFVMAWLQPSLFVTWFHILFIGCFGMITFSVATRVTLAHGAYPPDLEIKSRALWLLVGFLVLSIAARILYGVSDGPFRTNYLYLAVAFWLLAVGSWSWSFLMRIFRPGPQAAPSC